MKKVYTNFEEIDRDLHQISLEKQIAFEELKLIKNDLEDYLKPITWLNSILKTAGKYGVFHLLKRIIK